MPNAVITSNPAFTIWILSLSCSWRFILSHRKQFFLNTSTTLINKSGQQELSLTSLYPALWTFMKNLESWWLLCSSCFWMMEWISNYLECQKHPVRLFLSFQIERCATCQKQSLLCLINKARHISLYVILPFLLSCKLQVFNWIQQLLVAESHKLQASL